MRKKKLLYNTLSSLGDQLITLICGFILPRFILGRFGSEVNGLVNSITQFLQIIAFLDMGVGAVVQSSLYRPLAEGDAQRTSAIIASASRFFRRIALILVGYTAGLMLVYPRINGQAYGFGYVSSLILVMSITFFAQYYYGMTDKLLLMADQRGYIYHIVQAATHIGNTAASVVLIQMGAGIHAVRLSTSLIYLLRPLLLRWYVNRHYPIDRHADYEGEPIAQKWNGFAQHISAIVLDNTDTAVLTVFSTLTNVSIYGVYHLVIYGIKTLFTMLCDGIQSLWGDMWAKGETEKLTKAFSLVEWLIHMAVVFLFGCTAMLIVPFVRVYTDGITDADYIVPAFALLITVAHGLHCVRLPYHMLIKAAGHYKQTQHSYTIATIMNIAISIVTVKLWGLVGVAIGTLAAMLFQTAWMLRYDNRNLIRRPVRDIARLILCDMICCAAGYAATFALSLTRVSYGAWVILAIETAALWLAVLAAVNVVFYRHHLAALVKLLWRRR